MWLSYLLFRQFCNLHPNAFEPRNNLLSLANHGCGVSKWLSYEYPQAVFEEFQCYVIDGQTVGKTKMHACRYAVFAFILCVVQLVGRDGVTISSVQNLVVGKWYGRVAQIQSKVRKTSCTASAVIINIDLAPCILSLLQIWGPGQAQA